MREKNKTKKNNVDPDKTACYKLSQLDLLSLQRYLFWSVGLKGLTLVMLYPAFANSEDPDQLASEEAN